MKKISKILFCSLAIAGLALSTGIGRQTVQAAAPNLNKNNTVTISHKAFIYNHRQSASANAKRRALIDAQNSLSDLEGQIKSRELETGGAAGFFANIANDSKASASQKEDARHAFALLKGQNDAPSWYESYVHLGADADATSLSNLYKTLPYYDQFMKIRSKYSLSTPQISLTQVAIAMLDADYSSHVFDHARYFNTGENLAWGSPNDPNAAWMAEEKIWNKGVAKNPSLASYKDNAYALSQRDHNFYEQVGHYLNLINPQVKGYGYALNTRNNEYGNTESFDYSEDTDGSYSASDYKAAITAYYNDVAKPDQIKAAKAQVKAAKKSLQKAIKQSKKRKQIKRGKNRRARRTKGSKKRRR